MPINIDGNAFYVLTFPTANETWCYNAASKFWHKLKSYPDGRWRGNCSEYFNGKNIVGDYQNGKLYEVDFDTYTDNSELIRRSGCSAGPGVNGYGAGGFAKSTNTYNGSGATSIGTYAMQGTGGGSGTGGGVGMPGIVKIYY